MGRKRERRKDLPPRVYCPNRMYYLVAADTGKWVPLGRDYGEAMREWARLTGRAHGVAPGATLGAVMDEYLLTELPRKAPRTQEDNRTEMRRLRKSFGHMLPEEVEPKHIYSYMDARGAPVRANREKALLSVVFRLAIRKGLVATNPCKAVSRNTEIPRDRLVEDAELEAFLAGAGDLLHAYVRLKGMIALRQGDMLSLHRGMLKDDGIHVVISKRQKARTDGSGARTAKETVFLWTPELREAVDAVLALRRRVSSLHLFCNRKGQPYGPRSFKSLWSRAMAKFVDAGGARFTEHDLRGRVATAVEEAGGDAQKLLQHKTRAQTDAYVKRRQVQRVVPFKAA